MPLAALTAACALPASNPAGSSLEACTSTETPPEQQLFPRSRQLARQRAFEARTRPGQPTLRELLAAASDFDASGLGPGQPAPVTAVLNVWNRRTLCRQLEALLAQTAPPALIWVCAFGPTPLAAALGAVVSRYNDSRIVLLRSEDRGRIAHRDPKGPAANRPLPTFAAGEPQVLWPLPSRPRRADTLRGGDRRRHGPGQATGGEACTAAVEVSARVVARW